MRLALILILVCASVIFWNYGTLEPCGILRAKVRQQGGADGAITSVLSDGLLNIALEAQYGHLTEGRCVSVLLAGDTGNKKTLPISQASSQQIKPNVLPLSERIKKAERESSVAIQECRNKRLNGELKSYAESANCSDPFFVQAFSNAGYPYMDLIDRLAAKRLEVSEMIDAGKLTEGQAQLEYAKFQTQIVDIERQRNKNR